MVFFSPDLFETKDVIGQTMLTKPVHHRCFRNRHLCFLTTTFFLYTEHTHMCNVGIFIIVFNIIFHPLAELSYLTLPKGQGHLV